MPTGVTGQTLNYNGTAWVANSTLYNNGTYIGIGTTSPTSALQVNGMTTTNCLKILGGCDLAEPFDVKSQIIIPGIVLL